MLDRTSWVSTIVNIGGLPLGGMYPIRIQSMTNTDTNNTKATVDQIMQLADAGCDFVRMTTQGIREAENLYAIKDRLLALGYDVPLIADIHFNPKAAEVAAAIVAKVRINPGNYIDKKRVNYNYSCAEFDEARNKIAERLLPLLDICKKNKTVIRVGTNHGSLSDRMLARYGNTPLGMVESTLEFVDICRENHFHNLVLSVKSSHTPTMIEANRLLVERMYVKGFYFPIHLGVTEAGDGEDARIKSAAGIGTLLALGIGDTIRVSLTEDPVHEVPVAKKLVANYGQRQKTNFIIPHKIIGFSSSELKQQKPPFVLSLSDTKSADLMINQRNISKGSTTELTAYKLSYNETDQETLLLKATVDFSLLMINKPRDGICIQNLCSKDQESLAQLGSNILQGLGLRYSKPEYIACPSCGRTLFNLMEQLALVREKTHHLVGLKIAVMGCAVNGPGEMADAHYGYVGAGFGKVNLYKNKNIVSKNIPQSEAVEALIELIKQGGDWRDSETTEVK